ncbi:MAG: glycerophosphodiester phosphodiesterase family protein [Alphaproteobacteria bacterium]
MKRTQPFSFEHGRSDWSARVGVRLGMAAIAALSAASILSPALARPVEPEAPALAYGIAPGGLPAFFECMRGKTTLISGHRGGVEPGYPENAIETMAHTLAQAPMVLEIDIRTTSDDRLVLMHDATLERTTTGEGKVSDSSLADIQALSLEDVDGTATAFSPPSLREALRWARGKAMLQLDVKRGTKLADVVRVVQEENAQDHAAVIVYSVKGAAAVHRIDDTLMLSVGVETEADLEALAEAGVRLDRVVAWTGVGKVRPAFWQSLRDKGHSVAFGALWTIDTQVVEQDNPGLFAEVTAKGVDILATDHHIEAYAAVQVNGSTPEALKACAITDESNN